MLSDISKWEIKDDGTIDTSKGDIFFDSIYKTLNLDYEKWKREHKHIPKQRIRLTDEEKKERQKVYQHYYYLNVTKIKRKTNRRKWGFK